MTVVQIVEFTGLPGSGKTSIRRDLVARLRILDKEAYLTSEEAFYRVARTRGDRHFRALLNLLPPPLARRAAEGISGRTRMQSRAQGRFFARHRLALKAVLDSPSFLTMPEVDCAEVVEAFLQTGSLVTLFRDALPGGVRVFFDEGLVQKSLMLVNPHQPSPQESFVKAYLDAIPLPSILVRVATAPDTCRRRMKGRPKGLTQRLRRVPEGDRDAFLERIYEHLEIVAGHLRGRPEVAVIDADSTAPLGQVVSELAAKIHQLGRIAGSLSGADPAPRPAPTSL